MFRRDLPAVDEENVLGSVKHEIEEKLEEYFCMRQSLSEFKLLKENEAWDLMWVTTSYAAMRDHSLLRREAKKLKARPRRSTC
jgi:hypothetical protein